MVDTTPADVDCPEVNELPGPIDWPEFIVIRYFTIRVAENCMLANLDVVIPVDVETCDPLMKSIFEIILGKHIFDLVCLHD